MPAIVSCLGELVERVDELNRVLGVVDRVEAERRRWMHRILVLRRAEQLTRFPGHNDVMVGGALDVGESCEDAAARELAEGFGCSPRVLAVSTIASRQCAPARASSWDWWS